MHRSPAYENRLGFFNMQECSSLGAYEKDEEKAAKICFYNFGVTFTMLAPTHVKGSNANSVYKYLAAASGKTPTWNFNKYVMAGDGETISHYMSGEKPLGSALENNIRELLEN